MKKLLLLTVLTFSIALTAQTKKTHPIKKQPVKAKVVKPAHVQSTPDNVATVTPRALADFDFIVFKGGHIIVVKGDKSIALSNSVKLPNESVITPDGKMTLKNGAATTINEGDIVDAKGNINRGKPTTSEIQKE